MDEGRGEGRGGRAIRKEAEIRNCESRAVNLHINLPRVRPRKFGELGDAARLLNPARAPHVGRSREIAKRPVFLSLFFSPFCFFFPFLFPVQGISRGGTQQERIH